jgi:hypothetical protein
MRLKADVDRGEPAGDPLEHDVQPVALGEHGVDHRLRVRDRRDLPRQAALVVGADGVLRDPTDQVDLLQGMRPQPVPAWEQSIASACCRDAANNDSSLSMSRSTRSVDFEQAMDARRSCLGACVTSSRRGARASGCTSSRPAAH